MPLPDNLRGQELLQGLNRKAGRILADHQDGVALFLPISGQLILDLHDLPAAADEPRSCYFRLTLSEKNGTAGTLRLSQLEGAALLHTLTFRLIPSLRKKLGCGEEYLLTAFGRRFD